MTDNNAEIILEAEGAETAPPKQYSLGEKLLLPISLLIAILFDRLIFANAIGRFDARPAAVFWLCYIVIFYLFYRERLKRDKVAHFVAICAAALCLWHFIFPEGNWQFASITWLVIPSVLMAHAQWSAGAYTLENSEGMVIAWLLGWIIKPFSGLFALFGAGNSLLSAGNKSVVKRVLAGVCVTSFLMLIVIPLLMSADQVFNYYLRQIFSGGIDLFIFTKHAIWTSLAFGLFYSFLWNVGYGENKKHSIPSAWSIDNIISSIVMGSVMLVYVLFCLIQFTYLFAGAGLPAGMTYSEYAREGFAQTVVVCAINLLIFGVFLRFGTKDKLTTALLGGLLALTGVMLFSGAVRLNLYIGAYGMTWLRLLSTWFIIYLAVVIALCTVRLFYKKQLPVAALCALLLLLWYVALGYLNPDSFIAWYNYDLRAIALS